MSNSTTNSQHKPICTANDLEVLKLLYVEWENRQTRLWSLMTKSATFNLILILLPAISDRFGFDMNVVNVPHYVLPICGIIFAIVSGVIAQAETLRLIKIKYCIKDNANLLSDKFSSAYASTNKFNSIIPMVVLAIQILAAIIMIVSLA